jgi:hypothetical protein
MFHVEQLLGPRSKREMFHVEQKLERTDSELDS